MSEAVEKPSATPEPEAAPAPPLARQPFTFGGVARFAGASWLRLLLTQLAAAGLCGAVAVWFLAKCYAPVVWRAVGKMPADASIANGQLTGIPGVQISETKFLSIALAEKEDSEIDEWADAQVTLRPDHVEISSLVSSALGFLEFKYGAGAAVDLGRARLEPMWGAWEPVVLAGAGVGLMPALLLVWAVLAAVYAPGAKLAAWFCDRQLSWSGAWRLASAAQIPGAVLMAPGLLLYGWQAVDVFGLAYFWGVHLFMGWVYAGGAGCFAPRMKPQMEKPNPFSS